MDVAQFQAYHDTFIQVETAGAANRQADLVHHNDQPVRDSHKERITMTAIKN